MNPVLEISGVSHNTEFEKLWPGHKHETVSLDEFVGGWPGLARGYAHILVQDALQRVATTESKSFVALVKKHLMVGGRLHLIVPAAEWAARNLLMDNPHPAVLNVVYGSHETAKHCFHSMWTMRMLRGLMEIAGLRVERASEGRATYKISKERDIQVAQHHIEAVRDA